MTINRTRDAQCKAVGDRQVDEPFGLDAVVVAIDQPKTALELVGWPGAGQRDVAAQAVATEQRALRTFLNLDPLQIDERAGRLLQTRLIDFVNIKADARVRIGLNGFGVNAADRWTSGRARTRDAKAGNGLFKPGNVTYVLVPELLTRNCDYR